VTNSFSRTLHKNSYITPHSNLASFSSCT